MTATNGYITLAQFKTLANVQGTDSSRDAEIEETIEAVSRLIDGHCHRRFYVNGSDETRYYTSKSAAVFDCPDDIVSITTLATDADGSRAWATTWATTDYDLQPFNAVLDGKPYTQITLNPMGTVSFVTWPKGVKIVGKFGYNATCPEVVSRAAYIQCNRLWLRQKAAPFGIAGGGDMGQSIVIPKLDPDIELLLSSVRRL
jgi:hypothetical protein